MFPDGKHDDQSVEYATMLISVIAGPHVEKPADASPAQGTEHRAENTRRRERQMKQFKSAGQAQRFLSAHDQINNLFHLRRDHVTAAEHRASRTQKFQIWAEICSVGWR